MLLTPVRRWLTARSVQAAHRMAPAVPPRLIDLVQQFIAAAGPHLPVLSRIVRENLRSAGVLRGGVQRAYFAQVALHLANAVRVFRAGRDQATVRQLALTQITVDDSLTHLRRALEGGQGAVIAPPHVCNYLLTLVRLNLEVPLWVYLRWSADQRKLAMKRAWCEAAGLRVILEPARATDPASRAAACVEAVRDGAALVMTPDIAQKRSQGVPVRLFDRQVYLPTGPAAVAMLAGAPLVPVFGRLEGGRHVIEVCEPVPIEPRSRSDGGRQASIQHAMQRWAQPFESFLRHCPEAWFFWGDNRWTRVFRGDPLYTAPGPDASDRTPAPARGGTT